MPSFCTGVVTAILSEREGLQRVEVEGRRAYVLTRLIGPVAAGDRVVVNTTAVDLRLGTGGWDVVHWNLTRESWSEPGAGHVMKLRYTSLQFDSGTAEERPGYEEAGDLGGMPVIACALHSQVPCVAVAFKHRAPGRRLAFVMTDAAALPLALSDMVDGLRRVGLVDICITAGQAFGGDHEAVNVASALQVARSESADAVVVGSGPGGVGTNTTRGFGALEVSDVVDAASRDGARAFLALRWSDADPRTRHRGLSHHSAAALRRAHASASVAVPRGLPIPEVGRHHVVEVDVPDMAALLKASGLRVTTMGRGPDDDPGFFSYAGAAGVLAAQSLAEPSPEPSSPEQGRNR